MAERPRRLAGLVAVVTGSTTGIGEVIARRFAAEGASVLVHGRDIDSAHEVVQELRDLGAGVSTFLGDLQEPSVCHELIEAAVSSFGRIDILVNNAALTERSDLDTTDASVFDRIIGVNLRAPLLLTRAALPHFRANGGGRVINIGSVNAYCGAPNLLAYAVSKGGLMTMTRNLAAAYAAEGIYVSQFNVGWVLTPNEYALKVKEGFAEGWHLTLPVDWAPSGALLSADVVAHYAVAFADPDSGPVTGTVLELEQFPIIGMNLNKTPLELGERHLAES
jgi:NAD(P)-dependent dehydrogenase (short-subunit alcohol dehydrogenase family)